MEKLWTVVKVVTIVLITYAAVVLGFKLGYDHYHNKCFGAVNIMVDDAEGSVVFCGPVGKMTEEELSKFKESR